MFAQLSIKLVLARSEVDAARAKHNKFGTHSSVIMMPEEFGTLIRVYKLCERMQSLCPIASVHLVLIANLIWFDNASKSFKCAMASVSNSAPPLATYTKAKTASTL